MNFLLLKNYYLLGHGEDEVSCIPQAVHLLETFNQKFGFFISGSFYPKFVLF